MDEILWTPKNIARIAENDLTPEDVEAALLDPVDESVSRSTGRPCVFGYTDDGDYIIVIYELLPQGIYPVTAYRIDED